MILHHRGQNLKKFYMMFVTLRSLSVSMRKLSRNKARVISSVKCWVMRCRLILTHTVPTSIGNRTQHNRKLSSTYPPPCPRPKNNGKSVTSSLTTKTMTQLHPRTFFVLLIFSRRQSWAESIVFEMKCIKVLQGNFAYLMSNLHRLL